VKEYCVWVHVNFIPIGSIPQNEQESRIEAFAFQQIRNELQSCYPEHIPRTGDDIRALFEADIRDAELTLLHGIARDSSDWNLEVNKLTQRLFKDNLSCVSAILRRVQATGIRVVVVRDNTDQLGEGFQQKVFLFSQRLSAEFGAFCIVSLREEKFFAASRRGVFDAFGDRTFHIGSPDLGRVLSRRLEFGVTKVISEVAGDPNHDGEELKLMVAVLRALIRSTTARNAKITRMLSCVSGGDIRHALESNLETRTS